MPGNASEAAVSMESVMVPVSPRWAPAGRPSAVCASSVLIRDGLDLASQPAGIPHALRRLKSPRPLHKLQEPARAQTQAGAPMARPGKMYLHGRGAQRHAPAPCPGKQGMQ